MRVQWCLLLGVVLALFGTTTLVQARPQLINDRELSNPAVVQSRFRCILDRGPCDKTGNQLKAALPEVLQRNCAKCTRTQKAGARKLIAFAQQRYPAEWAQVQAKYSRG